MNSDKNTQYKEDCNKLLSVQFKIVMFIYVLLMLYLFAMNRINDYIKIAMVVVLYIMLYIDYKIDYEDEQYKNKEKYNNLNDKTMLSDNHFKERLNAKMRNKIAELNRGRNYEGRFYVDCQKCGRHRIEEDITNNKVCGNDKDQNKYCSVNCVGGKERAMSFYNNKYVDRSKIFCYNPLIDECEKNSSYEQDYGGTYIYFPTIADPINGPPYLP